MKKNNFAPIETIISVAKKGGMFILVDDEKRENEGDLVISSSDSTAKNINFMAKHGRGLICLALDSLQAKRLNLSLMSPVNQSRNKTAFTISIEAKKGITISKNSKKFDAFLALGCVIKGQTPHFDFISQASTNAIMDISVSQKKPVGNGIITCLNMKQAKARKSKGAEAANAVFSVLSQK